MKNKVEIIEATSADFHAIAMIYNEFIALGTATMDETLKTADDIAGWCQKFHDREKLYVLKEEDTTIGWGIIKRYSDREGYRFACETAVYITASQVGKGYGTMMKKHLIASCKKLNYKHLIAKIFANNKGSIAYNLNLGYTIVGTQQQIGFKNDRWQDVVIMQYIID
ncbi:GNAT family N-acetyltransferase [Aureispira anguillae]|uniref:N-acetyltransferase family protein n=1 Tax=Aureispira anguillae TaxID=2864201 RepID=A0A915YIK0_9BACT|nr:GNAT family N-acetyltransferase [Aureispira anguillae]BDS13657.1 N-acetyltransferase family protein [Aureispira anguillae]